MSATLHVLFLFILERYRATDALDTKDNIRPDKIDRVEILPFRLSFLIINIIFVFLLRSCFPS